MIFALNSLDGSRSNHTLLWIFEVLVILLFKAQFFRFCLDFILQGTSGFYNIDNEEFEAMPVEIRLLPRKLRFFISAERREQLLSQPQ